MAKESNNRVVQILMKRNGISEGDAKSLVLQTQQALMEGDYEAIQYYLGLEDDYIFDVLDF